MDLSQSLEIVPSQAILAPETLVPNSIAMTNDIATIGQEVIDLDSYEFSYCTCPLFHLVTDPIEFVLALLVVHPRRRRDDPTIQSCAPPHAIESVIREAEKRYAF